MQRVTKDFELLGGWWAEVRWLRLGVKGGWGESEQGEEGWARGEARVRKAARGYMPRYLASTQNEVIILVKQKDPPFISNKC